jgi:RecA-family ATPase
MSANDGKPAKRASRQLKVEHLQLPPHSIEAEQSVLGGLMLDAAAWAKVSGILSVDSFYRRDHRLVYGAMADLQTRGSAIDFLTVADHLEQRGELADVGGLSYLGTIQRDTPSTANILTYAVIVRDRAALRALKTIGDEIAGSATNNGTAAEIVVKVQNQLRQLKLDVGAESMREPIDWPRLTGEPPPRSWWIPDWLAPNPMLFSGAGGKGKTTVAQAVATALVTNRSYLETPNVRDLRALIWNCEDDHNEIWRKQGAINSHFGLKMADLEDRLYIVPRLGLENTMFQLSMGTPVFTPTFYQLREQVNDLGIDLLILDNISQIYGGLNDQHQVTQFVNAFAGLVRNRPFASILLGHIARSEGSEFSGSAAWENAVRMRWYLGNQLPDQKVDDDEAADPDVVYLAKRKANYTHKDFRRLRFKDGLFIPDQPEGGIQLSLTMRSESADIVVMDALPKLINAGLQPSDKPQSGDYLPKKIVALGYHQDHTKAELTKAMNRLLGSGQLRRIEVGKYSNRTPRYGLAIV